MLKIRFKPFPIKKKMSFFKKTSIFQKKILRNLEKIDFLLTSHIYAPTNEELNCGNFSSIHSKIAAWRPFLFQNFNKSSHNSKSIAPSNFLFITKIMVHGNTHPMDYCKNVSLQTYVYDCHFSDHDWVVSTITNDSM